MTVQELISKLATLPADAQVVVPGVHQAHCHFDSSALRLSPGHFVTDAVAAPRGAFVPAANLTTADLDVHAPTVVRAFLVEYV